MGKLFDALSKAPNGLAEITAEAFVDGTGSPSTDVESNRASVDSTAPVPSVQQTAVQATDPPAQGRHCRLRVADCAPILPFDGSSWMAAEQYRIARTRVIQHPARPRSIVISSAGAGDGKSTTSINLAGVLGLKVDGTVLLVDADIRRGNVAGLLGLPSEPGLTDVLVGKCSPEEALITAEQLPRLSILTAGKLGMNPVELLDSPAWEKLTQQLSERFQYVIYDSPPMGSVADYDLIQARCDGVIVVIRPDHTNRHLCLSAVGNIPKQKLIGVIINCSPQWIFSQTPSYYYSEAG